MYYNFLQSICFDFSSKYVMLNFGGSYSTYFILSIVFFPKMK